MKRVKFALLAGVATMLAPLAAHAQDASQIQSVIDGKKSCIGCNLFQASFGLADLTGRDFENARLRQADLSISTLDKANLKGANLSVANMFGVRAQNANLQNADLTDATLVGAWLGGADLTGAKLDGTLLSGAYLKTARGLTATSLSRAYCDDTTQLPAGLTSAQCRQN